MAWKDLDFEAGWWSIPSARAKNARSHRVPLSATALGIIQARNVAAEGNPWVFPGRGDASKGHVTEIKKLVANAKKLSGCDWTPHDLRRTASTGMGKLNFPRSQPQGRGRAGRDLDLPAVPVRRGETTSARRMGRTLEQIGSIERRMITTSSAK